MLYEPYTLAKWKTLLFLRMTWHFLPLLLYLEDFLLCTTPQISAGDPISPLPTYRTSRLSLKYKLNFLLFKELELLPVENVELKIFKSSCLIQSLSWEDSKILALNVWKWRQLSKKALLTISSDKTWKYVQIVYLLWKISLALNCKVPIPNIF